MPRNLLIDRSPQADTYAAGPSAAYLPWWRRSLLEAPFTGFDDGT